MRITDFPMLSEIKEEYVQLRKDGQSRAEATLTMVARYDNEITLGADDDGLIFWIGLADAQYSIRELTKPVADKAMAALQELENSDWAVTPRDTQTRRERYAAAPMPEKKSFRTRKPFRCSWQIGDTFAHILSGEVAQKAGLAGKYMLLRKVDEIDWGKGCVHPVMTATLWDDKPMPRSTEEFCRLPMLRTSYGKISISIGGPQLGAEIGQYEYRMDLLINSSRQLEDMQLSYIGNFPDVEMPDDEVIFRRAGTTKLVSPKTFDDDLVWIWEKDQYIIHTLGIPRVNSAH